jgi:hypothetical protein
MRKTTLLILLIAILCVPLIVVAQFEGTMTVHETTTANGRTTEGRKMTLYFAKDFFRWDQYVMGDIYGGSLILQRAGNAAIMLNAPKKKFCRTANQEWIDKKNYSGYNPFRKATADASKTGKKKTIAGFECTEWTISYKGRPDKEPITYTVWTTDKLGVQASVGFGPEIFETDMVGIVWLKLYDNGLMPLGWAVEKYKGRVSTVEVISVDKKKVDPQMFAAPKGYTEVKETSELFK